MRLQLPLRPPRPAGPAPAPARVSTNGAPAPTRALHASRLLLAALALVALVMGTLDGVWWLALPVGVLLGAGRRGQRQAVLTAAAVGLLGWLLPLLWLSLSYPIWRAGGVLAGILGVGILGPAAAVLLTALVGALLCGAGSWMGAALRRYALG